MLPKSLHCLSLLRSEDRYSVITQKKLLVLDLDETLVHTTTEAIEDYDYKFEQPCCDGEAFITVYVRQRPFLNTFLECLSNHYELAIFTAGQKEVSLVDLVRRLHPQFDTKRSPDIEKALPPRLYKIQKWSC